MIEALLMFKMKFSHTQKKCGFVLNKGNTIIDDSGKLPCAVAHSEIFRIGKTLGDNTVSATGAEFGHSGKELTVEEVVGDSGFFRAGKNKQQIVLGDLRYRTRHYKSPSAPYPLDEVFFFKPLQRGTQSNKAGIKLMRKFKFRQKFFTELVMPRSYIIP